MWLLCRVLIFDYVVPCGGTDPPDFKQVIQVYRKMIVPHQQTWNCADCMYRAMEFAQLDRPAASHVYNCPNSVWA